MAITLLAAHDQYETINNSIGEVLIINSIY